MESVDLTNLQRLGQILAASGYFTDARDMAQAAVKVMAGHELGLPPIASMMGINIIKGKVSLGAHLIASRIKAHGYDFRFKRHDNTGCTLVFLSKPDGSGQRSELGESTFTEEDAKSAGVFSDMYKKYPKNMYYSRAVSNGAKWFTPEIFGGAPVFTPEELGAAVDAEGNAIDTGGHPMNTQAAANHVAQQKIAAAQAEAAKKPDVPVNPAPAPMAAVDVAVAQFNAADRFKRLEAFGVQKRRLVEALGDMGEIRYYEVLQKHGVEKSNQFKTLAKARDCYREMFLVADAAAADSAQAQTQSDAAEPPADDRTDWLPEGM